MAKAKKEISIEEKLWESANKLRGSVESSEYKHVVLGLIFLKFASDKFEERRQELIAEGKEKYIEMTEFYTMKNVFYLPEISRWSYLIENSKQTDISLKIDTALFTVEKNNPSLKGALPDNYYSRLNLDTTKLSALLDEINDIDTIKDKSHDIVGRVYEYFLSKFAIAEGKGKGEFYTPKSIVNLIAEMIEPYKGKIYDPACGSGGMFVQSMKFIESRHGNKKDVSVYGQEYTATTYKLAKMNLAIRGISANLGDMPEDTFKKDQHKDLKADFIMANPPFNQKDWRASNELTDDPRWMGYDIPPSSNANYGWILNIVSKLSDNGVAGFLLANGSLSGGGDEYKIRKKLIENDLVEAIVILPPDMFYTTNISVTLWILNKNKKARSLEINGNIKNYRNREKEVLFMDLRQLGIPFEKKYTQFSYENIKQITTTYHNWQQKDFETKYQNIAEFCYSASFEEIAKKDFSLVPSKYIEFINRAENPYQISLSYMLERLIFCLGNNGHTVDIIVEKRGKKEDNSLLEYYNKIYNIGTYYVKSEDFKTKITSFDFREKRKNDVGIQLADLCAYPIVGHIRSKELNPAFEVIKGKFYQKNGKVYGFKVHP